MMPPVDLADLNRKIDAWLAQLVEVEPTIADPERRRQLRHALEQMRECQALLNVELPKEVDALAARTAAVQRQNAETEARLEALKRQADARPTESEPAPAPPAPIDPGRGAAWRDELLRRYVRPRHAPPDRPSEGFSSEYSAADPYQKAKEIEEGAAAQTEVLSERVIAGLVQLAALTARDVVYHLGCGDGRLLISAASIHRVRGVGVDNNTADIDSAHEKIRKARLQNLVAVADGDPLEADVGPATVVFLTLGKRNSDMLHALRRQLRPGARIVTHQGGVPGWRPHQELVMHAEGHNYRLCLWQVPQHGGAPGSSVGDMGDNTWGTNS